MDSKVQVKINKFNFGHVQEVDGKFVLDSKDADPCTNSESIYLDALGKVTGVNYIENNRGKKLEQIKPIDCIFVLRNKGITKKDEEKLEKIVREGIFLNDELFVVDDIETSSETRKGDTPFIKKAYAGKIYKRITLNKFKNDKIKVVTSKAKGSMGLAKSSAYLTKKVPKIIVIPDYEKDIIEKEVNAVSTYKPTEEDKERYKLHQMEVEAEKVKKELYYAAVEEYQPTQDDLKGMLWKREKYEVDKYQSKSKWLSQGRRVKADEVKKPICSAKNTYTEEWFPCYSEKQTEEIKIFPSEPMTVGYQIETKYNYPNKINCFDGMGLVDPQWVEENVEKKTNGLQVRGIGIKGLVIKVNFKEYYAKRGVTHLVDVFGESRPVQEADMIIAESMFKMKLDKADNNNNGGWLFKNIDEYYQLLTTYELDKVFGIVSYIKDKNEIKQYVKLTYQHLLAFNLTFKDIMTLSKDSFRIISKLIQGQDVSYIKAVFNMLDIKKEDVQHISTVEQAIEYNHRMLFDPFVRKTLITYAKNLLEGMKLGEIFLNAQYYYITGDVIGFLEWAEYHQDKEKAKEKVIGFLNAGEFYQAGDTGRYGMLRNPLTFYGEVKDGSWVNVDHPAIKYIEHLDNLIQFNMYDSSMTQISGLDFDGDKVLRFHSQLLLSKMIKSPLVVSGDEESEIIPVEYNTESLVKFKKANMDNMTGLITNYATFFANKALEKHGDLKTREFELQITKHLQGLAIDQVKTSVIPNVPELFKVVARKKAYFLCHKYKSYNENEYQKKELAKSPMDMFAKYVERKQRHLDMDKSVSSEYFYDIQNTKELLVDYKKYSLQDEEIQNIINGLRSVWSAFNESKTVIDNTRRKFNKREGKFKVMTDDERKDFQKKIRDNYRILARRTREEAIKVCDNESVLASLCAEISYNWSKQKNSDFQFTHTKTYNFFWACSPKGILENLSTNEDENKILVTNILPLNGRDREYEGTLKIKNGTASISDASIKTKGFLEDGNYRLFNILGRHYIDYDKKLKIEDVSFPEEKEVVINGEKKIIKELVPLQTSPSMLKDIKLNQFIKDYSIKLIKLQDIIIPDSTKSQEEILEAARERINALVGQELELSKDKVMLNGKLIGTIRQEDMCSSEVELYRYNNKTIYVKEIEDISNTCKSFTIKVDIH